MPFTLLDTLFASVVLGLLLLLGYGIKRVFPILQQIYLPESVIGGTIALLLGPEGLGWLWHQLFCRGIHLSISLAPLLSVHEFLANNGHSQRSCDQFGVKRQPF